MSQVKHRSEFDPADQWDVDSVYPNVEAWEADFVRIPDLLAPITALKGKLDSPAAVAAVYRAEDELGKIVGKLYLYAHMREDVDLSVGENQARMARIRAQYARIGGEVAFINPQILALPEETIRSWMDAPELAEYRRSLQLLLREKPHTLSEQEETLLGMASDLFSTPHEAFGKLTNADMKFTDATDAAGASHQVSNGTFYSLLLSKDRDLRRSAFGAIYAGYGDHQNTLATLLAGSTKSHVLNARVRKFPGALEASLFRDNIDPSVYMSLISAVNQALPVFHEYLALRAEYLGVGDDLNVWDLHTSIVPEVSLTVDWKQCREWVEASTRPLGPDYQRIVESSFTERWYDIYENKGKRSGAYSTGHYGEKPFMLLNYHGTLNDVFTVAHELGHSMHSWLSQHNQPFRYGDYPIFLAEIASTTNEALLHDHLMRTQESPKLRAYLLNHLCDSFRGTMFRQTMFAEFELEIHRMLERGEAITADAVSKYYYDLNARYHGPKVKADDRIAIEWMRIPHFYYNFYVYKYATGFAAAQLFARQVQSGTEGRDRYLGFLKSGSSKDPLDTVRDAGVDLADPVVLTKAVDGFRSAVKELRELLATSAV
ncbi:oligoendopeptidase F [bacterium]|nr:oligoendopeptidase F [bacterium]